MTKPVLAPNLANSLDPATILVRGGATRSSHDETCEALFMTSGFVYDNAAAAEEAFAQEGSRFVYSRYRNPTVAMFEERLRLLEGAEACRATASGMAAVFAALLCRLHAGQRVVSSRALFGSCHYIVADLLPRWGIETVLIDGRDLGAWETALAGGAALAFCESPSNPAMEIIDLAEVARLTHRAGGILVSSDSLQNWVEPDEYFSDETRQLMAGMGFFQPANLGPLWLRLNEPQPEEFARLSELPFRHALCGHGAPLCETAKEAYTARIQKLFAH